MNRLQSKSSFPIFFPSLDGDPKKTCKQELSGLHGALQGEQISECEERLWHHPLLSRDELPVCRQDDHSQGQVEHGQRLDVALKKTKKTPHHSDSADQSCPAPPTLSYCCIQGDLCNCAHLGYHHVPNLFSV